ncbi:hypothetical protein ACFYW9_12875 [Streptomyces sp. NPDC002698]|uniref:DUF4190 domain-containing protein n=1 Tax=Streptomyces sp. NPDC002698 TaxID=3364660 RepID=UPI0036B20F85
MVPAAGADHGTPAVGPARATPAAGPDRTAFASDGGPDDGRDGRQDNDSDNDSGGDRGGDPGPGPEVAARWVDSAFDGGPGHAAPATGGAFGEAPAGSVPAQGAAPFAVPAPDARISLGKREADRESEFDPWAPPEELASPGRTARGSAAPPPAYGLPAITSLPGTPGMPGMPGPGHLGGPAWDNPFAPPTARTPYPQPFPGEPVPPPPIAPGGPGLAYGYGYPQYPGAPAGAVHPGVPGYGWPVTGPMPSNGLGTAGLVLGIIAAVLFVVWPLAIVLGVLAVVFGLIGGAKARRGEATNPGQALAGVILGAVGLVLAVGVFVLIIVFAADDGGSGDAGDDGFSTSLVTQR